MNQILSTTPSSVPTIPSDYASLGVVTGYDPVPADDVRLFLLGVPGCGKSTLLASTPDTLILDFENGARGIPNARAARIWIRSYEQLDQLLKKLIDDGRNNKRPFRRIGFDTADQWVEVIKVQLCREKEIDDIASYGREGAGYGLLARRCWSQIEALEAAGYTWTVTSHYTEKTITSNGQTSTVLRPAIIPSIASLLTRNCEIFAGIHIFREAKKMPPVDVIMQTKNGPITVKQKPLDTVVTSYTLCALSTSNFESKIRGVPRLSAKIELPDTDQWAAFKSAYDTAVLEEKASITAKSTVPTGSPVAVAGSAQ